ncbi:hypothetical protein ACI6Q2_07850 [Chitinophagaceae bacterium LWZ2-11]
MEKIETGTIFKFTIPFNLGIGYAKFEDWSDQSQFYGFLIKVFDFFEDKEIVDMEIFRDLPLFMNPIPISKRPTLKGKYSWKKLGVLKEKIDLETQVFKRYQYNGFAWGTLEEYQEKKWYADVNFKESIGLLDFDKVRHLEELFIRSTVTIERRVAMQLLRYKGIDVEHFFDKNAQDRNWIVDFYTQQWIPLYKLIPLVIRGKPLIEGFVPNEYLNFDWNSINPTSSSMS